MNIDDKTISQRESTHDAIDLIDVLDMLWRSWSLIAKTTLLVTVLGVSYAWLARPVYESNLLVQIEDSSDNAGTALLGSLSSFLGVKSSDDAEIEILRSRKVVGAAVDQTRYDILAEPARFPLLGQWIAQGRNQLSVPGLFGLGGYAWGNESIDVNRFDTPPKLYETTFSLVVLEGGRYRLSAADMGKPYVGHLGEIAHIATDAGPVILDINTLRAAPGTRFKLTRYSRQLTVSDLQKRLSILDKAKDAGVITVSLQSTHADRGNALITALGESYVRQNSEQKSQEAQKSLAFLEQQLPALKQELHNAEQALLAYRNQHGAIDLSEQGKLIMGQLVALQTRVSLLQQDRRAKLEQFTREHPAILAIDSQIASLQSEMSGMSAQLKSLPNTEQDMLQLTRDVRVNTDLYVAMLNSMQQLRLLRAGKVGNVRIVDKAELPELPVKPRKALVIAGSLLLGLLLGGCIALFRHLWRGAVSDPREIEQLMDVPVQAMIPLSKSQSHADRLRLRYRGNALAAKLPLAISQTQEPAVESLRSLSIALQLLCAERDSATVLLTSPQQNAGKSFVASNLAVLLAKAGRRVLLIDGDLRKGVQHRIFNVNEACGLATVLQGDVSLADAIQLTGVARLHMLSSGTKPAHSTELLQGDALSRCVDEAASNYDIVLIDTAPVLPVADTLVFAQMAGAIYAVARYGMTTEGELVEMRARLLRAGKTIDGIVLNGMQPSLSGLRYGHYGYGSYVSESKDAHGAKGQHA